MSDRILPDSSDSATRSAAADIGSPATTSPGASTQTTPQQGNSRRYTSVLKPALGVFLFGIALPLFTLGYELWSRLCAGSWFDPLPTWWHTALVALVPLTNLLVFLTRWGDATRHRKALARVHAVALGVVGAYALAFLPYLPISLLGVVFLGMGFMPLSPIFALMATWSARRCLPHWGRVLGEEPAPLPRAWPLALGTMVLLALPVGHNALTQYGIELTSRADPTAQRRGLTLLRIVGSEREMLEACYPLSRFGLFARPWQGPERIEKARATFYRVTGTAFNTLPAPAGFGMRGFQEMRGWNRDAALGGERVSNKVAGLSLESSRLDAKVDALALTSYTEWTLVFKNVTVDPAEARAQIELPPGGVVSRLSLWIDGEPREAAFGGRTQVRAAYQEVAVVQRRDPVLVTTCGPDRVLMQCFPVPANGGEMKVRLGLTAPLDVASGKVAHLQWPRMLETNFESGGALRHTAWAESATPFVDGATTFRRDFTESDFAGASALAVPLDPTRVVVTDVPGEPDFVIRQGLRSVPIPAVKRLVVVIDGSRPLRSHREALAKMLGDLAPEGSAVFFAGDTLEQWPGSDLRGWLKRRTFRGGADNLLALEAAWAEAERTPDATLLWIHGPQPVLLSRTELLLQLVERGKVRPAFFSFAVGTGPNRIFELLDGRVSIESVPRKDGFEGRLHDWLRDRRGGLGERFVIERQRVPRAEAGSAPVADRHVARLWGREEIERLRAAPATLDAAVKLAIQLQLVTPVSGAVVLERQEQYDRHGLKPADAETVPVIPEPAAAALLAAAAGWLGLRRRRK